MHVRCQNIEKKIIIGQLIKIHFDRKLRAAIKVLFSVDIYESLTIYTEKLSLDNFTNICGVSTIC